MDLPKVVSSGEWDAAQEAFRAKEKAATSARDALAAERRRLPRLLIEKEYTLEGPAGEVSLAELFEGRRQLLLYHFMFGPNQSEGCDGCSMFVDGVADLAHLQARDTSFALVSRAPIAKLEAYRARMGWRIPWYSSASSDFSTSTSGSRRRSPDPVSTRTARCSASVPFCATASTSTEPTSATAAGSRCSGACGLCST